MKLSSLTIILIGVSVAIIALSYALFQHYLPNQEEIALVQNHKAALQREADKLGLAQQRVANAEAEVRRLGEEWQAIVATNTPPASLAEGGIDLSVNSYQLTVDSRKFRNSVQAAVNNQVKRGGVKVIDGPSIPEPDSTAGSILSSYYNFPALPFPVVIYELGQVTVEGSYKQITEHIRSYESMPRYLAVTHDLEISGTSPRLRGTYTLTVIGYIRGKQIFKPFQEAAGGSGGSGGSGGGAGGGRGGGNPTGASAISG